MKIRSALGLFALAGVATLALLLAACGGGEQPGGPAGGDESANPLAAMESAGNPDSATLSQFSGIPAPGVVGGTNSVDSAGGVDGSADAFDLGRKITRTASLEVTVDNVLESVQKVEEIAVSAGGFVSNSSLAVTSREEGDDIETATVKIRVPAEAYSDVLGRLRGLAKDVRSQSEDTQEVTEEYTDLQSRMRNLEATERRYLDLLSRATTISDILSLEDRLSNVRGQIEQVQGRINVLDDLTDLATISVRLVLPAAVMPVEEESQGWVPEAWDQSWEASRDVLVVVGSIAIATVVFLPWFLVPTLIGLVAWRILGRRVTALADKVSGPRDGAWRRFRWTKRRPAGYHGCTAFPGSVVKEESWLPDPPPRHTVSQSSVVSAIAPSRARRRPLSRTPARPSPPVKWTPPG